MKKFCFLLVILFDKTIIIQIKKNPITLTNNENPFVLSTPDDDYYYVITKGKDLKINKESGDIDTIKVNSLTDSDYFYIFENSNNHYVYNSSKYYEIIYNPFISYREISVNAKPQTRESDESRPLIMTNVGSIAQDEEFIIYGYCNKYLLFSGKSREYRASEKINEYNNLDQKLSCKFIIDEFFICASIINFNLDIYCLKYHINPSDSSTDSLESFKYESGNNLNKYNSISSFGLYDTDKSDVKFLCRKENSQNVKCNFLKIQFRAEPKKYSLFPLGDENLQFISSNDFREKNCCFSLFNSEYLFCCALKDRIQCYRINFNTHNIVKVFQIPNIIGINSYLTIKSNSDYVTLFFMNTQNFGSSVNEYYIYLPKCENKNYDISNSLNGNKPEEEREKLSNLFIVKANNYYFEIENSVNDFGYFTLNNEKLDGKKLIDKNNYILDFIFEYNNTFNSFSKIFNYIVSVEAESAYEKKCHITLNFKACYHSCKNCSLDISYSNELNHNCITCRENYYKSPTNKNNCYSLDEKKLNWYLDSANSEFGICHEECHSCTGPTKFNCSTCSNGLYLDNNSCKSKCSEGYFPIKTEINSLDYFFRCDNCYKNCKTCLEKGTPQKMNCEFCKENQIKYNDNCFDIKNSSIKSFYEPENNDIISTSCYEKYGLYIKEDSNECISLPNEEEGYYISNNKTGLLSKCYENCFSCKNSPIKSDTGNIQSMECITCNDLNSSQKTMIKIQNNCFKILHYDESKIIFNISEMGQDILGTCIHFGKAI